MYEFKTEVFEHVKLDEFLTFRWKFQMNIDVSGTITEYEKIQNLRTYLHVKALHKFETLCAYIGHTTSAHLKYILLGLGIYFFPMNLLSKQKHEMQQIMRELKLMCYAAHMIGA